MIKGIFIFFFSMQFLTNHALGAELSKLPFLLSHFREYSHQNTRTASWWDFLYLHYADPVHQQSDPAHQQLPGQQVEGVERGEMLPSEQAILPVLPQQATEQSRLSETDGSLLPSDYRTRLLRPPQ
jgi:hypothetical protein